MSAVTVVGAGLAGCEAAMRLARAGLDVELIEMKPSARSPAHHSGDFGELVCSNSLRAAGLDSAVGLLKQEMRLLGSLIMECADRTRVAAGGALAVDRAAFSALVTARVRAHPRIRVCERRQERIPDGDVIVATGPLTDGALAEDISRFLGGGTLHFYDAAAPIVSADSIDMAHAFFASRYGKGTPDYINCPLTREQYTAFVAALRTAEQAPVHGFEDSRVFEGCMPVETMARRGEDALRFGPLKPVGIRHPETNEAYYAVVQLRCDNSGKTMYNMVGFQTHLKFGEQRRVFGMIPALARAEFLRYGVMHRNSYLDAPRLLDRQYRARCDGRVHFAGQITGVEGYVESAASGLCAAIHLERRLRGLPPVVFPVTTALGALSAYISSYAGADFQPMNINFGLIAPLNVRVRKKRDRHLALSERALAELVPIAEALR